MPNPLIASEHLVCRIRDIEQVGGIWFANPIQVYIDLLRGEGRAKEKAEHLRQEKTSKANNALQKPAIID